MKPLVFSIFLIALLAFIAFSCNNNEENTDPSGISGGITGHSECKNFKYGNLKFAEADTFSCVQYLYNYANLNLTMYHINAGFNCCPEEIYCEVSENGDTIIISEFEKKSDCYCLCLFDLDIQLNNIIPDKYIVRFVEPYAEGQEELIFDLDLTADQEGYICVTRKGNPWGE